MDDPYRILQLGSAADEQEIRSQYLKLVREFPPEREPARFAEIRAAYDLLCDPVTLVRERLLSVKSSETLESLAARGAFDLRAGRLPTRILMSLAK